MQIRSTYIGLQHWVKDVTRNSAVAEGPRDALNQLKSCQLLYNYNCCWLWPPYRIGQAIIFCRVVSFFFYLFSSPNLSGRRMNVYHTSTHDVVDPSANLECRSERCCTRLAGNAEPKNSPKHRHLRTIAQICRAISSQIRHISTIGKNLLSSNISSTCPHNRAHQLYKNFSMLFLFPVKRDLLFTNI